MTLQGRDSYIAWRFHIYGCPKRTSQTSSGATSQSTSSLKGLMPYGRMNFLVMHISHPWLSEPMLYDYGCHFVERSNLLMTSVEFRFVYMSLLTTKCRGIPFTQIYEWKRCSSAYDSSGSSIWIYVVAIVAVGSASMICLPLYVVVALGWNQN